jgi:kumamolisin
MSYASSEVRWSASDRACIDSAIDAADAAGVALCVSSGDCGAKTVNYPGSSPNALACGGTMFVEPSGDEHVWNNAVGDGWMASSGGVSAAYPVPDYQSANHIEPVSVFTGRSGRGLPDVAGPAMGVVMASGGSMLGTSVAAPFFAAFLARLKQALGVESLPGLKETIYQWNGSTAFFPILVGTNAPPGGKGYAAGTPWNACTGLGTPDGSIWLANLRDGRGVRNAP